MADKQRPSVVNYAGPGAVVGIQAADIIIGGGIVVGDGPDGPLHPIGTAMNDAACGETVRILLNDDEPGGLPSPSEDRSK